MGEFFRGWRRMIGCVTLAMAGTLAIAWGSSFHSCIWVQVAVSRPSGVMVVAGDGCLTAIVFHNASTFDFVVDWGSNDNPRAIYKYERPDYIWVMRSPHVRYGSEVGPKGSITTLSIALSLIVVPLTILSAYLILWPGKLKTKRPGRAFQGLAKESSVV